MKTLQLGISEFALPAPRSGHIEAHSGYGGLPNVGQAIHLEVQARRMDTHPGYVPEKWVTHSFERGEYKITISGRIDGFVFGRPAFIEEIKSAYNLEALKASLEAHPHHPYKLQLRTYGYLHWLNGAHEPSLNLHLVNARTREGEEYPVALDVADYEAWLERRVSELIAEQKRFEALAKRRKKSVTEFVFPFPEARPGQRELMDKVNAELTGQARLLLQAPTGLGKTAGVLFPVLQESMRRGQKTLYLTAKNSQHEVAEDAARRLQDTGVRLRSVTVHAKAKMCMKAEPHCDPKVCEFANRHYDKLAEHKLDDVLAKKKRLTQKSFKKLAETYEVCPFELQMEALPYADVVICDYNYVFSPRNALGRLTHNGWTAQRNRPNLVVDEVHNLPARANDYYSAQLACEELAQLVTEAPLEVAMEGQALLGALRQLIADKLERASAQKIELTPRDFAPVAARGQELFARYMDSDLELQPQDPVLRASGLVSAFAQTLELINEDFFVTATPTSAGGLLRVSCCDASRWLRETYDHFAHVVGFSATLKPFEYYQRLLGLKEDGITAEFASPFPAAHRKILLIPQISTKYRDRASNMGKIKEAIARIVSLRPGNYFVFFPSFEFMNQAFANIELPGFRVLCQRREMRREAVDTYLAHLREQIPTVIFAVQGGVFAEGVDYPGDMLIGALIVGPALPNFDFERELLREYYDEKHGSGFDYAYTYPAMARVIQSAGRVIRSPQDRGLIVLMDRRFTHEAYRKSMPQDWAEQDPLVSTRILNDIREFWENGES